MEKNEIIEVQASSLGTNGEGIARLDGVTLFVPNLLPEERAKVRVLKVKGNIGYGRVEELLVPAEDRVRPKCSVFHRCGGCQLQHMRYRTQLKFKTGLVRDALKKIAGLEPKIEECEKSEKEYAYRNKLQLPIGRLGSENVVGFYAERSHRIVKTEECPIHPEWARELIAAVYRFMEKCGLDGYDEETGKGQLRHIVVRELKRRYLITLVATVREIKGIDYFYHLLDEIFPEYSFFLSYNDAKTNVIFGEEPVLLRGKGSYECTEAGISFEAGASTFVQVNEGVRGKLYEKAVSLVTDCDTVIDCYAGGGLLTAMFAKKCKMAYGVEIVPEASQCADKLAARNNLQSRMVNICGKVEDHLSALLEKEKNAVVVLDPPRSGIERSALKELISCNVEKIIMISCNPATLARDLGILTGSLTETEKGELVKRENFEPLYDISLVQPFDMFPQTKWVETLVVLNKI